MFYNFNNTYNIIKINERQNKNEYDEPTSYSFWCRIRKKERKKSTKQTKKKRRTKILNSLQREREAMAMAENDIEVEVLEREGSGMSDAKSSSFREPLLRNRINTTSQIAIVGANVCPIESLDYEYF